jgi:eight-cysteine-cluster-containing protein
MRLLCLVICAACHVAAADPAPLPPSAPPAPASEVASTPVAQTPSQLYAVCRERVERPEAAGECAADADCGRAGCSAEVCVPAASAVDVITTCEVQPCFAVLDACACHGGVCQWTLLETAPPPRSIAVPPSLVPPAEVR